MNSTRRSILSHLAGGATALALATTASKASALPATDAELVSLATEIAALHKEYVAASAISTKCHQEYARLKPEKPRGLLWRVTDPVTYSKGPAFKEGGKTYLWCDEREVEKLRGKKLYQHAFIGTAEDAERLGVDEIQIQEIKWPVQGSEHLWQRWPDKRRQKRAAELLKVYDDYKAAVEAAWIMSGAGEADDFADAIMTKIDAVYDRMSDLEATTLEGFRAQAQALVFAAWSGHIEHPNYQQDFMISRIMSSLSGIPIDAETA